MHNLKLSETNILQLTKAPLMGQVNTVDMYAIQQILNILTTLCKLSTTLTVS